MSDTPRCDDLDKRIEEHFSGEKPFTFEELISTAPQAPMILARQLERELNETKALLFSQAASAGKMGALYDRACDERDEAQRRLDLLNPMIHKGIETALKRRDEWRECAVRFDSALRFANNSEGQKAVGEALKLFTELSKEK